MVQEWVVGVSLAMTAALCSAIGDNLVKYSFKQAQLKVARNEELPPMYMRPHWLGGMFFIIVLSTTCNLGSYAFADASITIPFGGLHICFNIPLARYMNGEVCSGRAIMYNGVILVGVMICLMFGNHSSDTRTTDELVKMLYAPLFIVCTLIVCVLFFFVYRLLKSPVHAEQRVGFTVLCGLIGSVVQVTAKMMSECLKAGAWGSVITWVSIVLTIVFASTQLYTLNLCLDRYAAFFVVPIVNSTLIVFGSIYAAVYFQEVYRWDIVSSLLVPVGIIVTSIGIACLSTEPEKLVEDHVTAENSLVEEYVEEGLVDTAIEGLGSYIRMTESEEEEATGGQLDNSIVG